VEYKCTRREFLYKSAKACALAVAGQVVESQGAEAARRVADVHSQLAISTPSKILQPKTIANATAEIKTLASAKNGHLAICGSRHAAGGQEFANGAPLLDTRGLDRVIDYNVEEGTITVEPGIRWPELIEWLHKQNSPWTFRQKQTGNDRLTIGGTLSANAHGQGLRLQPIIGDVQAIELLDAAGKVHTCSRMENRDLFRLAMGGYGNFGLITRATLQLTRRVKYRRTVEQITTKEIESKYRAAIESGARYGDFQCSIDDKAGGFLREGIWKEYQPVVDEVPLTDIRSLIPQEWVDLVVLAHTDKRRAWATFGQGLLKTNGAVQYNEFWQGSPYVDNYHAEVDRRTASGIHASELLTELYVPLDKVHPFIEDARALFLSRKTNMVYSTVRFIEKDDLTFLPWARSLSACVIFNIHTEHSAQAQSETQEVCRALIDAAIKYGGSYYLTYHRYARKDQVLKCYPEFVEFLKAKRHHDPKRVFRSDWYAFYEKMFATELG
jgi:FAD/FMN-containing dehydrogenase